MVAPAELFDRIRSMVDALAGERDLTRGEAIRRADEIAELIRTALKEGDWGAAAGTRKCPKELLELYDLAARAYIAAASRTLPLRDAPAVGAPAAWWVMRAEALAEGVEVTQPLAAPSDMAREFESRGWHPDEAHDGAAERVAEGIESRSRQDYEGAMAAFRDALRLDPGSVVALVEHGRTAILTGPDMCRDGVELLQRALLNGISDPMLYLTQGNLFQALDHKDRAIAVLREGLQKYPEDARLHVNLGQLLWLRRISDASGVQQAIWHARRALDIDSGLAVAHNNLAYYLIESGGDLFEARARIEEALRTDPSHPHFLDTYATLLRVEGKISEAIAVLLCSISVAEGRALPHRHLAELYWLLGREDDARAEAQIAVNLAKRDRDLLREISHVLHQML